MKSPNELIEEIKIIKNALNEIDIRGERNANNLLFACQTCDHVINDINAIIQESLNRKKNEEAATEAGE